MNNYATSIIALGLIWAGASIAGPQGNNSPLDELMSFLGAKEIMLDERLTGASVVSDDLYISTQRVGVPCESKPFLRKNTNVKINLCSFDVSRDIILTNFDAGHAVELVSVREQRTSPIAWTKKISAAEADLSVLFNSSGSEGGILEYSEYCDGTAVLSSYNTYVFRFKDARPFVTALTQLAKDTCSDNGGK